MKNVLFDVSYIFTNFIGKVFTFNIETLFRPFNILVLFLSVVFFFFLLFFLSKIENSAQENDSTHSTEMLVIAILWIFLSILPFWIINESYITAADPPHADRNFLASVLGVSIVFCLILEWFIQSRSKLIVAFCFLSAFFFHQYTEENDTARWQTKEQNNIYWQLFTRMPEIQSNTALVDEKVMFPFQGNFATASAINILYPNPINEDGTVPLWVFNIDGVLYEKHAGYHTTKRIFKFIGPGSQSIFLDYGNQFSNCVWVFSPEDTDNPHLSEVQKSWILHSDISRILINTQSSPDKRIFGSQPNNWCVYYQQAALSRQFQSWDKLHDITNAVLEDGFTPSLSSSNSPFEWWPFIESLIRDKDFDKAQELTLQAIQTDPAYSDFFCNRWDNLLNDISVTYNTKDICTK
jgi:uncharacterized membrane protein